MSIVFQFSNENDKPCTIGKAKELVNYGGSKIQSFAKNYTNRQVNNLRQSIPCIIQRHISDSKTYTDLITNAEIRIDNVVRDGVEQVSQSVQRVQENFINSDDFKPLQLELKDIYANKVQSELSAIKNRFNNELKDMKENYDQKFNELQRSNVERMNTFEQSYTEQIEDLESSQTLLYGFSLLGLATSLFFGASLYKRRK